MSPDPDIIVAEEAKLQLLHAKKVEFCSFFQASKHIF